MSNTNNSLRQDGTGSHWQTALNETSPFDDSSEQCAVFVSDFDGTITHATQPFVDCFKTVDQQPVGSSLEAWFSAVDDSDQTEALFDRLQAGQSVRRELSVSGPLTETNTVVVEATPVEIGDRSVIVGFCHDRTEHGRSERRHALLAEVSRAIGEAERYEQGLKQALQVICRYTEWAYGEVWTPADQTDELTYTLGYADEPSLKPFRAESQSVTFPFGEGLPGRVYATQSPEWIATGPEEPVSEFHRAELADDTGVQAAFGAPVTVGETVSAVLVFFMNERCTVDESLARDVSIVVDSLGGLIEQKRTEALLRSRADRLEEFATVLSHDLRNPLNVAMGNLEQIQAESEREHVETIAAAHERMEELIEELLSLTNHGKAADSHEPIVLAEIIQRCWETVETPDATVHIDTDRVIQADQSRLRQIVENLLRNAVVHGGPETAVTVGDLDSGFYIADDGPGVPTAHREAVFEPGHTTHTNGNGLGLSIVRDIVSAHGWEISVTEAASGGARFEITNVDCVGTTG